MTINAHCDASNGRRAVSTISVLGAETKSSSVAMRNAPTGNFIVIAPELTSRHEAHRIREADGNYAPLQPLAAPSFNGRTADSGSAYRGSNPWGAAKHLQQLARLPSRTHPPFGPSLTRIGPQLFWN